MTEKTTTSGTMEQAIAEGFSALLATIQTAEEGWRERAAEALHDRDDAQALKCLNAVQHNTEAAKEIENTLKKWQSRWPAPAPPDTPATSAPQPKGAGSKLRVHLNGQVIECPYAAETFARTIAAIGIERVLSLGKSLSGFPLISKSAADYQQQFPIGEFRICTHSNTQTKKRFLNEIAGELGIPLRVEITSGT